MHKSRALPVLVLAVFVFAALGSGQIANGQNLHLEVGGGTSFPNSSVVLIPKIDGRPRALVDQSSGPHVYASAGLSWGVSSSLDLGTRLRVHLSHLRGNTSDLRCAECRVSNEPKGRVRAATFEGRIRLTSLGRIQPYFLVGLGVVRTTVDGATVTIQGTGEGGSVIQFQDVAVTDVGGDVGVGARMRVVGGLYATTEVRVSGSLPGSKENAMTVFPLTVGLSYTL